VLSQILSAFVIHPAVYFMAAVAFLVPAASLSHAQEGAPGQKTVSIRVSIPGLLGEEEGVERSAWIEVLSLEWGTAGNPSPESGTLRRCSGFRAGSIVVGDLTLTRIHDTNSPLLARACSEGRHFASMIIEMTTGRTDGGRYIQYELQDVILTSTQDESSGNPSTESFSFNYVKSESKAIPDTQRGKLDSAWDVENSEP